MVFESMGSPLLLRCRSMRGASSFVFTFVDHDGSPSHAAAISPLPRGRSRKRSAGESVPILVSLHGTGVSASDQADAHKRLAKRRKKNKKQNGKMVFGVKGKWTLAPTRFGAHNWEFTGQRSALAATLALQRLSEQWLSDLSLEGEVPRADALRLVVSGHSMGGHGALALATHFPGRTLCLTASAGWDRKESYGKFSPGCASFPCKNIFERLHHLPESALCGSHSS